MCGYQQWCKGQQPLRRTLQLKGAPLALHKNQIGVCNEQQQLNSSTPAGNKKLLL